MIFVENNVRRLKRILERPHQLYSLDNVWSMRLRLDDKAQTHPFTHGIICINANKQTIDRVDMERDSIIAMYEDNEYDSINMLEIHRMIEFGRF